MLEKFSKTPAPKKGGLIANKSSSSLKTIDIRSKDAKSGFEVVEYKKTFDEKRTLESLRKGGSEAIM